MAEVTTYNDYVDLANQEYNLILPGATEDNLFTNISNTGERNQLARYYYNKTGLNISASNRIVIAPKNGYMINRLSYIDNDLVGGVKSGIQALNIDTSNQGEIVLRNKGSIGQIELIYVFHSLAYALGIKIDTTKVDILPVLNEALRGFEFLYFAPLNIARTVTSENISYIDVLFIVYNNRTYFDEVLLQSLANAMYNAGWFNKDVNIISNVSDLELNVPYSYNNIIYKPIDIALISNFVNHFFTLKASFPDDASANAVINNIDTILNTIFNAIPNELKNSNLPYTFSMYQFKNTSAEARFSIDIQYINNTDSSLKNFTCNEFINSNLVRATTNINTSSYVTNNKFSCTIVAKITGANDYRYLNENSTGSKQIKIGYYDGENVDLTDPSYKGLYFSNINTVVSEGGVEGITIIDNAKLPTGIDSLESDYPLWAGKLEEWTVTSLEHLEEKIRNMLRIISFLPLNLITDGITYPEKEPGVPYTPIEVTTWEVLLPEIIPPQRPNKVIKTLTLIPDEDDTVEDPEDPKTYEPIIDPKHPNNYPPTNKYYYDIDVEVNYPKDFIDPIGGTNDNPSNPTEPPSKNHGNISIPPKNPTDSVTSSKLFTVYNPTADQIDALGGYLWGESIAGTLASIFTNPLNAIISLHCIYCEPDVIGTKEIRLGYLASGVSAKYVVSQYKEVDCGTIRIPEYYGDCRDYSPYTTINLFLPFIGFRPIKVDDVMGSELSIKYFVDVYTGTCLACVSVNKGGVIQLTYNFDGNCSVMLPLTSGSWANMTVGLATALTSMIVNPVAGALQIPNAVHNGISMSSQGQLGCNAGAMGRKKPYVVITNTQAYDAIGYNELYGYPANILTKLSQLEGYTKVKEVHVENVNNATVDEKNEIERLLKSGVIIS